ncbi:hypothetical protein [Microvirga ossetica]
MDEPDHTRLRGIVDEAYRRRAVLDMEPRILAIADGSSADLVELSRLTGTLRLLRVVASIRPMKRYWRDACRWPATQVVKA